MANGVYSWSEDSINETGKLYANIMRFLLEQENDFIVVQSSGNGTSGKDNPDDRDERASRDQNIAVDAINNGLFCAITEDNIEIPQGSTVSKRDILDRIIIVGNAQLIEDNGQLVYQQAVNSNYGKQVTICSPGTHVYSTVTGGKKGSYAYGSGTSAAAPIVTGVCGLVWSINPDWDGAKVRNIVCENAGHDVVDNPDWRHNPSEPDPRHHDSEDYRLVNAKLAVEAAISEADNPIHAPVGEEQTTVPSLESTSDADFKTGDDGSVNWDFIVPVAHQKQVPEGYIGIYTATDLDGIRNNLDKNYILMNDIDLSQWSNWAPIGTEKNLKEFRGIFDGNGYVVRNMKIHIENDVINAGLFGYVYNGQVRNVGIESVAIRTYSQKESNWPVNVGSVVGALVHRGMVENCYSSGEIHVTGQSSSCSTGGIIGTAGGLQEEGTPVLNCYNKCNIKVNTPKASPRVGGISGYGPYQLERCFNLGAIEVTGANSVCLGGVVGMMAKTIS